jgi:hypothetical protein
VSTNFYDGLISFMQSLIDYKYCDRWHSLSE